MENSTAVPPISMSSATDDSTGLAETANSAGAALTRTDPSLSSVLFRLAQPLAPAGNPRRVRRAVEKCQAAWSAAYQQAVDNNFPENKALRMAAVAYKLQIPKMISFASTKAAFACIMHGISLEVFQGQEGSQQLYGVQVANSMYKPKGTGK